jgi:hypothetical protein
MTVKRTALHKVTCPNYARTKLKCHLVPVSAYWAQFGCKVNHCKYYHVNNIFGAKLRSVPIISHANIMPGYPIHHTEGLRMNTWTKKNKNFNL